MTRKYPLAFDLRGKKCAVIGGGRVAERKIKGILASGGAAVVVSPRFSEEIRRLESAGLVKLIERGYAPGDLEGARLAFVATDDPQINRAAALEARRLGVFVNVADDPEGSDFFVPAVARKGGACVAVSTDAPLPAVAAWLRDKVSAAVPDGLDNLLLLAQRLRNTDGCVLDGSGWYEFLESGIMEDLARGSEAGVRSKVERFFGPGSYDEIMKFSEDE